MVSPGTIEQASAADFSELTDMLVASFRTHTPDHPRLEKMFPDVYRPTDEAMGCNQVVRRDGKIAGCVGVFPVSVWVAGRAVTMAGIGGVSTRPEYRGQGVMAALMDRAQRVVVEQGYALSWLGGDRCRYMRWGYELACAEFLFTLSARGPGFGEFENALSGSMRLCDVSGSDWEAIWSQASANPKLAVWGSDQLRLKYTRIGQKVYASDGGHIVVCEGPQSKELRAWGGDPRQVGALVAAYITSDAEVDRHTLDVFLPWYPDSYCPVFKQLMSSYSLSRSGNVAVFDVDKTFQMFKEHFDDRVRQFGLKGRTVLRVAGMGHISDQQVVLEADGEALTVTDGSASGDDVVELNRHQIVELMFSPLVVGYSVRWPDAAKWVTSLFPAPLFLPRIANV